MKFISFVEDNFVRHEPFELHTYKPRTFCQWLKNEPREIIHTQYMTGRFVYSDIIIEPELELITIGQKITMFETSEYIFHGIIPYGLENGRFTCTVDYTETRKI